MYKVIVDFTGVEGKDCNRKKIFRIGDEYPAPGFSASKRRIAYLLSNTKGFGKPVIEELIERQHEPDEYNQLPRQR